MSADADRLEEARRRLRYASEDLAAASDMLAHAHGASRHVCWLAQQAAEKALKAALIFLQVDFPWRHDLDALRDLLPAGWQVKEDAPDLAGLTEWAVAARYPTDLPDATSADAEAALRQASAVYEAVAADLRWHEGYFT